MQKKIFSKILSTILVLSLILSVFIPMGNIIGVAEEVKEPSYSSVLNKVANCEADGWVASFSSNPQGGIAFTDQSAVSDIYECWSGGITRRQKNINWHHNASNANVFGNMGALTYTAQKYKYFTMTIEYKYEESSYPRPIITFNQQNTTPEMFYKTSTAVPNPSYSEDPIGVFFEYEGSINISGKKTGTSRKGTTALVGTEWHKAQITVTPGNIYVAVYNTDGTVAVENNSSLSADYQGGYISLMQNGVSFFRNISITKLDYEGDYSSAFTDVDTLRPDGWKGYYSANAQGGVPFTEISDADFGKYYEDWKSGAGGYLITRSQTSGLWSNSYNNYYQKMAALTYTSQKYKYFKFSINYKFEKTSSTWPVFTFNQPSTTPQIHYIPFTNVPNPTYGEKPIGVHLEYEGSINISSKAMGKTRKSYTELTGTEWHKAEIIVTPGKVRVAVYNTDGTVANEVTKDLPADYEGGYISIMQMGLSHVKNVSIIEYPELSINNYSATPDGNGGIANDGVLIERTYGENVDYKEIVPERAGYSFMGFYSDAEYANKIELNSTIDRKATVYTKWSDFADITADGNVDLIDLVRIKKMASNVEDKSSAADLDFDGTNASGSDITVLRKKLIGSSVSSNVYSAAELMNDGILYPLGRTMVLDGAVEMDHVNTGFIFKGELAGDVKADFTTNRVGSLLNVSVDGGENKVIEMSLDGLTTLAEDLEKGEHTIEVISGTSMRYSTTPDADDGTRAYDGALKLNKLYYSGTPLSYESDKASRILFLGDSITCGMGLDTSEESGYKASNSYYTYASVLGRMLGAEIEVNARCGAKVCHFVWAKAGRGKGLCDNIDWLKSINVRNNTEYDYANNQPDLVVINLGTNDIPYEKDENGNWVGIWDDTGNKYSEEVPPLLKRVHTLYPNAKIIWTVGMMDRQTDISKEYIGYFKNYVETWSAANDNMAYFLDLSSVADRTGHSGHPTIAGHAAAAEELYNFILENNIGINASNLAELDSVQKKN